MKKLLMSAAAVLLLSSMPAIAYQSLQEVFDQASGNGEYDKYLELDQAVEYLGDLIVPYDLNACIEGNGALIHGRVNNIAIKVFNSHLDISNCIILNGLFGIFYDTLSTGSINSNTVSGCDSAGIVVFYHTSQVNVEVWDNIIVECNYGFLCIEDLYPNFLGFNTIYNAGTFRYGEFCPT